MKKIGMNVYSINELEKDVKAKVIDRHRYDFSEFLNDDIQDEFKEILEAKGYPTDDIRYRLSNSQGDGMAFYGEIDTKDFIKKRLSELEECLDKHDLRRVKYVAKSGYELTIEKLMAFHIYDHYNTMIVRENYADDHVDYRAKKNDIEKIENSIFELAEFIRNDMRDVSRELEKLGYDIIDRYTNDEYVEECIIGCDMYFTEDGEYIDITECEGM